MSGTAASTVERAYSALPKEARNREHAAAPEHPDRNLHPQQQAARQRSSRCCCELEPLFACNLACAGCGKIQHPADVLKRRMPVEQAVAAVEECGAPMVSIAGGEPLMHPQIDEIVAELVAAQEVRVPVHQRRC